MSYKPSVLVVDDESGILDTLRILLRNEGFEVTTAQGGKAGLEQIRSGAYEIILSDVRMPGATGIEALRQVRRVGLSVPFVLMTAFGDVLVHDEAQRQGALLLDKPFDAGDLRRAIVTALG